MSADDTTRLPRGGHFMLVASTGGHLAQLTLLADLLDAAETSHWVTFDSAQSASLLAGRSVTTVPYVGPRQLRRTLRTIPTFARLIHRGAFDAVISTGAAVAAPALVLAAAAGVPAYYVESVSRVEGPSLTGRLMMRVPRVRTFTQHAAWRSRRWSYDVSVLDGFGSRPAAGPVEIPVQGGAKRPLKVFVSLGTIKPYRFDALVEAVRSAVAEAGADVEVTWQLGCTLRLDLPGRVCAEMPVEEFERTALDADLVITHAGVATCLRLVELGVKPLVVPRRQARGEHVDDHQTQIARELAAAGLCTHVEVPDLDAGALRFVASAPLAPPVPPAAPASVVEEEASAGGA